MRIEFGHIMLGCMVLIILLMLYSIVYKPYFSPEIPCLKEIAEEYCEEQGLYSEKIDWFFGWRFYCKEYPRQLGYQVYIFLEEEIEGCKR